LRRNRPGYTVGGVEADDKMDENDGVIMDEDMV